MGRRIRHGVDHRRYGLCPFVVIRTTTPVHWTLDAQATLRNLLWKLRSGIGTRVGILTYLILANKQLGAIPKAEASGLRYLAIYTPLFAPPAALVNGGRSKTYPASSPINRLSSLAKTHPSSAVSPPASSPSPAGVVDLDESGMGVAGPADDGVVEGGGMVRCW